jgi:hypothetical protein
MLERSASMGKLVLVPYAGEECSPMLRDVHQLIPIR